MPAADAETTDNDAAIIARLRDAVDSTDRVRQKNPGLLSERYSVCNFAEQKHSKITQNMIVMAFILLKSNSRKMQTNLCNEQQRE